MNKIFYKIIFILLISGTAHAENALIPKGVMSYMQARFVIDALKIVDDREKVGGFDATTMQLGFGIAAGIYQKFEMLALKYEVDYTYTSKPNSFYHTIMANFYIEATPPGSMIYPYIMAGFGMSLFDPPFSNVQSDLAVNFGAGAIIQLDGHWGLDFGFRYLQSNIDFRNGSGRVPVKNHNFLVGIRYLF